MQVKYCLPKEEKVVDPFTSIASIEDILIDKTYIVVMDHEVFRGVLTQADVLQRGHQLAVDCLTPKSQVYETDEIENVIQKMSKEKQYVLPVFNGQEDYLGSITYSRLIKEISLLRKPKAYIKINNIIGAHDIEQVKQVFINELYHNTKNPIQIIYSSLNLIKGTTSLKDQEQLLESIENSTKQIDDTINQLFVLYFGRN